MDSDPFDDPLWKEAKPRHKQREPYIGCPIAWLKRVLPLVKSQEQLAIGLYLHRRSAICGGKTFTVPNRELYEELGITRYTKYRALRHLEQAGVIAATRNGKRSMKVTLLW